MRNASKTGTYRLSTLVGAPGGRTSDELLQRANTNLAQVQDKTLADFDAAIAALKKERASAALDPRAIYTSALVVSELGGMVGYAPVGRAAHLLCSWIDLTADDAGAMRQGLDLHINAIDVLRRAAPGTSSQNALLEGLEALAAKRSSPRRS